MTKAIEAQRAATQQYNYPIVESSSGIRHPRYKTITIQIRETSNGQIVSVGEITRLCPSGGNLLETIAAALAEHELDAGS